jgi:hypothetical protein
MEHYMKTLKGYVRNKARLEGSMVEGYTIEEALKFRIEYLQDFIVTKQRVWDEKEDHCMVDEVVEGNDHLQKLNADL